MDIGFVYQLEKLENGEGFFRMIAQITDVSLDDFAYWDDSVAE